MGVMDEDYSAGASPNVAQGLGAIRLMLLMSALALAGCAREEARGPKLEITTSGNMMAVSTTGHAGVDCVLAMGAPWEAEYPVVGYWKGAAWRAELELPHPRGWRVLAAKHFERDETLTINADSERLPKGQWVLQAYESKGPFAAPAVVLGQSQAWLVENLGDSWAVEEFEQHVVKRTLSRYSIAIGVLITLGLLALVRLRWSRPVPRVVGVLLTLGALLAFGYQREFREVSYTRAASGLVALPIVWPENWPRDPLLLDEWLGWGTETLLQQLNALGTKEPVFVKRTPYVGSPLRHALIIQRMLPEGYLRLSRDPPPGSLVLHAGELAELPGPLVWRGSAGVIYRNQKQD